MTSKHAFYFTKQIRQCEQHAISLGISEDELMLRAATGAFTALKNRYAHVKKIAICCGAGNNAGDGYVLARLAYQQGLTVFLYTHKAIEDLPPAAKRAAEEAEAIGILSHPLEDIMAEEVELVIDALLGIGLRGEVYGPIAHAIHLINESKIPVLSLDVPSGLDADSGRVLGVCIHAHTTVTFIAQKIGLSTLDGPDHCGQIIYYDLQLASILTSLTVAAYPVLPQLVHNYIKPRLKNSHKGMFGHVLIIGGGLGMPGAANLAAMAALRIGAGLVSVATRPEHAMGGLPLLPEAMVHGIDSMQDIVALLEKASVCIVGPGLGEDAWARGLFSAAIASQLPLVVDAAALRMLADNPQYDDNWVLTPHPGEAARLLDCTTSDIQKNRYKAVLRIQEQYGGCVLLKGVGSFIYSGNDDMYLCTAGNPGMASAGMGDVLSGVIGGLMAQGVPLAVAARLGVWLHAHAGDEAALVLGQRGLLASDLIPYMRSQINM